MDDMIYDFGSRLEKLRKKKKLSKAEAARRLHIHKNTISGYENETIRPSFDVLINLSVFYRVSTDYLLGLKPKPAVYVDGLTERQIKAIEILVEELKTSNNNK